MTVELALVFAAGVVSFASPCVLPLIPVYLSVATGLGVTELQQPRSLGPVVRGTSLFAAGFGSVFVLLGLSATALGDVLAREQSSITRVGGVVVLVLAVLMFAGTLDLAFLPGRELRFHPRLGAGSVWAAPVTGAAFAFGWTPCIGPVLGSVLAIAAGQGEVLRGGLLLACYAAGLTLPLLATAVLFGRVGPALRWVRLRGRLLTRVSAVVMFGYGLMLAADQLAWLTRVLQSGVTSAG
jgi:cytochrome c-type biogenesis protein